MLRPSPSIYRGYCTHNGLGELPTDAVGSVRGEQYVAADAQLWKDPDLVNEARRWMTLYDGSSVADNVEGWSYFGYRDLRFVVRLISAGRFGSRLAYFAHARSWLVSDFRGGDDPGALLGRSDAFHPAWKEGQPIQPLSAVQPAMVWRDAVAAQPRVAVRLLAQLYRACMAGPSVVMEVPLSAFAAGSPIQQLVAFSRAALPLQIKCDCRIRVFTGKPDAYLREPKAHLVVIPEEFKLSVPTDAILLNKEAECKRGSSADESYARAVVDRLLALREFPESLFFFAARVNSPSDRTPNDVEVASVPLIYNLVAVSGNGARMDELLEYERNQATKRNLVLNWSELIKPEEWSQFSPATLVKVALSPGTTPDLLALRQHVREELLRRNIYLDAQALQWIAPLSRDARPAEILDLVRDQLISRAGLVSLLGQISGNQIAALLTDRNLVFQVTGILSDVEIPAEWYQALAKNPGPLAALITMARRAAGWRKIVYMNVSQRVTSGETVPGCLPGLIELPPPDPVADLDQYLDFAELLDRMESDKGRLQIVNLQSRLETREDRRRLFELLKQPRWQALPKYFNVPEKWDRDVGYLLLSSPEQVARINTDRVLRLTQSEGQFPDHVVSLLDQRMERAPEETTRALVTTGNWRAWRLSPRSKRIPALFESSARAWFSSSPTSVTLEEWKQVMTDLGQISSEFLQELRSRLPGRNEPWPQIPLFEEEQLSDMADRCPDLGALAELAETASSSAPRYAEVRSHSRFTPNISELALRCLGPYAPGHELLSLAEAEHLLQHAGNRRQKALIALGRSVIGNMSDRADEAERVATQAQLWEDASFQQQLVEWLRGHRLDQSPQLSMLNVLNRHVPDSRSLTGKTDEVLEQLADSYLQMGLTRLADFLRPDFHGKLVRALLRGKSDNAVWQKLVEDLKKFNAPLNQHPLMLLADKIKKLSPDQRRAIAEQGWPTFKRVCLTVPESSYLFGACQKVVPVLHLAVAMRHTMSLGKVAKSILFLAEGHNYFEYGAWWTTFFETVSAFLRDGLVDRAEVVWTVLSGALADLDLSAGRREGITELGKYMSQVLAGIGPGSSVRATS